MIPIFEKSVFEKIHSQICNDYENAFSIQIGSNPTVCKCNCCDVEEQEEENYFDSEANPQYDSSGRKTGSGEYRKSEWIGYVPETEEVKQILETLK
jgi:hypothetical protein